jgi:hypothetical protein
MGWWTNELTHHKHKPSYVLHVMHHLHMQFVARSYVYLCTQTMVEFVKSSLPPSTTNRWSYWYRRAYTTFWQNTKTTVWIACQNSSSALPIATACRTTWSRLQKSAVVVYAPTYVFRIRLLHSNSFSWWIQQSCFIPCCMKTYNTINLCSRADLPVQHSW